MAESAVFSGRVSDHEVASTSMLSTEVPIAALEFYAAICVRCVHIWKLWFPPSWYERKTRAQREGMRAVAVKTSFAAGDLNAPYLFLCFFCIPTGTYEIDFIV